MDRTVLMAERKKYLDKWSQGYKSLYEGKYRRILLEKCLSNSEYITWQSQRKEETESGKVERGN